MKRRRFIVLSGSIASLAGCLDTESSTQASGSPPTVDELAIVAPDYTEPSTIEGEDGLEVENPDAERATSTIELRRENRPVGIEAQFSYSNVFHDNAQDRLDYVISVKFSGEIRNDEGDLLVGDSKTTSLRKGAYDNFGPDESVESFTQDWMGFRSTVDETGTYELTISVEDLVTGQVSDPSTVEFEVVDVVPQEWNQLWSGYQGGYRTFATAKRLYSQARSHYSNSELEEAEDPFRDASNMFGDARTAIGLSLADRNNEDLTEEMREIGRHNMDVLESYELASQNFAWHVDRRLEGNSEEAEEFDSLARDHHNEAERMDDPIEPVIFKQRIWGNGS